MDLETTRGIISSNQKDESTRVKDKNIGRSENQENNTVSHATINILSGK